MNHRAWKAAALLLCALGTARRGGAQIRVKTTDGTGSSIRRGVLKEDPTRKELRTAEEGCRFHLAKAEEYFRQGRFGPACQKLRKAKALLVTRELAEKWGALAKQVDAAGNEQIRRGNQAFQAKQYRKAIKTYLLAWRTFSGLPAAAAARRRLAEVESNPDVAGVLAEEKAADLFEIVKGILQRHRRRSADKAAPASAPAATTRPAAAPADKRTDFEVLGELDDRGFLRAIGLLERILDKHPTTPSGQEAGGFLETLKADPLVSRRLRRLRTGRKARQELAKANAYCNAGLLKKAAGMYRRIIKKYPKTPQADQAARQLGVIQARLPAP